MRTMGTLVLLSTVIGCNSPGGSDAGWVHASDALAAHGVAAYHASATGNGQQVVLRDGDKQTIGELQLVQAEDSSTISLEFRADSWRQVVIAAEGRMTLSLDGREATLRWDGSGWTGDDAAMALLATCQPYADFVRLVGVEAQLGTSVGSGAASPAPADMPKPPADLGQGPPPTLCCSDVVTTGSGWAWYWEDHPEAMACKRANDAVEAACAASSGYDCCNVKATGCTACVDWGTGFACSTTGYLQYSPAPATSCQ